MLTAQDHAEEWLAKMWKTLCSFGLSMSNAQSWSREHTWIHPALVT